jgi:DEAD/DEAH box helicase
MRPHQTFDFYNGAYAMPSNLPTIDGIHAASLDRFEVCPHLYQAQICQHQLQKVDIVATAATGAGKSLMFYLPMLFEEGMTFIVSLLNKLGDQHVADAEKYGFASIAISAATLTNEIMKVRHARYVLGPCLTS